MGLLDGLRGNASEVDASKAQTEFAQILAPEERVEKAYQLIRDMFVFTNRRLVFVNYPLQCRDRRPLRPRCRAEDLAHRHTGPPPAPVQQEAQHLRGAGGAGKLRPAIAGGRREQT